MDSIYLTVQGGRGRHAQPFVLGEDDHENERKTLRLQDFMEKQAEKGARSDAIRVCVFNPF